MFKADYTKVLLKNSFACNTPLGVGLTHWYFSKVPRDDAFVQSMLRKTDLGDFILTISRRRYGRTEKKNLESLSNLCISVVYILKEKLEGLKKATPPLALGNDKRDERVPGREG